MGSKRNTWKVVVRLRKATDEFALGEFEEGSLQSESKVKQAAITADSL